MWSAHISRRFGKQLRDPLAEAQRIAARIKELDIKPKFKLLFS